MSGAQQSRDADLWREGALLWPEMCTLVFIKRSSGSAKVVVPIPQQWLSCLIFQTTTYDQIASICPHMLGCVQTILDLRRMDRPCRNRTDTKLLVKLKSAATYLYKVRFVDRSLAPFLQALGSRP